MKTSGFEMSLLVGGKPIREFDWDGRTIVEGRKGSEFAIRLKNEMFGRVMATLSVDGRNPVDGSPAKTDGKGYLLSPGQEIIVPGWLVNGSEAAAFYFAERRDGYAAQSGDDTRAGVIGCTVWAEKVHVQPVVDPSPWHPWTPPLDPNPWPWDKDPGIWPRPGRRPWHPGPYWGTDDHWTTGATYTSNSIGANAGSDDLKLRVARSASVGQMQAKASTHEEPFSLSTGFGDRQTFRTKDAKFELGHVTAKLSIYYDSRRNLERRGIVVVRESRRRLDEAPRAFVDEGFCKPPRGWRGRKRY